MVADLVGGPLVEMPDRGSLTLVDEMGLYPGTEILLLDCAPFNGPLTLDANDEEYSLGYEAAKSVWVALQR